MRDNIVAGLDIGSTAVRLVIGQKVQLEKGDDLQIIGAVSVPSEGISKGVVTSIDGATAAISDCLEKAERLTGVPITKVFVGVNAPNVRCERSKGVVAVGKNNGEITEEDVERAIEAARALSVPPNFEIIHVIPIRYSVDNQGDIKDPIGMTGVRLEVEILIVQALSSQINNLTKAIYRTGLEIEDLVLAPLAAGEAVLSNKQKELGAVVINMGSATTGIAIFEEGEVLHSAVLPIGSAHITSDVALGLRCPINLAERIKLEYGSAKPSRFDHTMEVDIRSLAVDEGLAEDEVVEVSRHYLSEIIEARVEEIFEKVDDELKRVERSGMLPAGAFIVGGGAGLEDLLEVAKAKLRLPASLGINKNATVIIDKVNDPAYLVALGLVVWGSRHTTERKGFGGQAGNFFGGAMSSVKGFLSKLKP